MRTMNVSLPDDLKAELDLRVAAGGFGTSSEYVRELVRRDLARQRLKGLLIEGLESKLAGAVDDAFFASLRGARPGRAKASRAPSMRSSGRRHKVRR